MLEKRIQTISGTKSKKADIRTRNLKLLELEGWYAIENSCSDKYKDILDKYHASGSTMKITRWCSRNTDMTAQELAELGKELSMKKSFKLSCRHNDLVRLADSKHYKTCYSSVHAFQQIHFLADPDIAVLYIPDASGNFEWRAIIRLVKNTQGEYSLVVYKSYGNGPVDAILKSLKSRIGIDIVMGAGKNIFIKPSLLYFTSLTKHNNSMLNKPRWTDHTTRMTNKRRTSINVTIDCN